VPRGAPDGPCWADIDTGPTQLGACLTLLDHPRWWGLLTAAAASVVAAWLLLVPITVVYVTSAEDPAPHDLATRYSWWTTEQNFAYSDSGLAPGAHTVNGVRLNCGNAFSRGPSEPALAPEGPQACSRVETPRCIGGLVAFALALLGLLAASLLPAAGRNSGARYRQPRSQRRALKRGW